jgi:hypothetical protein
VTLTPSGAGRTSLGPCHRAAVINREPGGFPRHQRGASPRGVFLAFHALREQDGGTALNPRDGLPVVVIGAGSADARPLRLTCPGRRSNRLNVAPRGRMTLSCNASRASFDALESLGPESADPIRSLLRLLAPQVHAVGTLGHHTYRQPVCAVLLRVRPYE